MEVLFTFLAERYERKSVMITTNLVFSEWERIFKDPMTTMAAIDRLVHHSVILDMMSVDSYRAEMANQQHVSSPRSKKSSSKQIMPSETVPSQHDVSVVLAQGSQTPSNEPTPPAVLVSENRAESSTSARLIAADGTV